MEFSLSPYHSIQMASPTFLEWYRVAHADDEDGNADADAARWSQPYDTTVQTRFGAAAASTTDVVLGRADPQAARDALVAQLAAGVIDSDNGVVRVGDDEMDDLRRGFLHSTGAWQVVHEPYPSLSALRTTLKCTWDCPYVPAFQVQLTVDEESAKDASKWSATGVLGPDGAVEGLTAKFDSDAGVLTLTTEDGAGVLTETFADDNSVVVQMLRSGDLVHVESELAALVAAGKAKPALLTSNAPLSAKLAFMKQLTLKSYAKQQLPFYNQRCDDLLAEPDDSSYHFRYRLHEAVDHIRLADRLPPEDAVVFLEGEVSHRQPAADAGVRPRCGGARARWLANRGWLDARAFNVRRKAGMLNEAHREYVCWQLDQLRKEGSTDKDRWRRLTRQVEALTRLVNQQGESAVASDDGGGDDEPSAADADAEMQADAVAAGQDLPADVDVDSDDEVLYQTLADDPAKVPPLLRTGVPPGNAALVDAVDSEKAAEQRTAYQQAVTSARRRRRHLS